MAPPQSLGLHIVLGQRFAANGAVEHFVHLPFTLSEAVILTAIQGLLSQTAALLHRRIPGHAGCAAPKRSG